LAACGGDSAPSAQPRLPSVTAAITTVEICPGQSADITGQAPASAAIQACVTQAGPKGKLELPAGTYLMNSQLKIMFPFTLGTRGLAGTTGTCIEGAECATLKAAPTFFAPYGIVLAGDGNVSVNNVVLDHITLDGARATRLQGQARDQCVAGNNSYGFNAAFKNCESCKMTYSASVNALCGTGMEWKGRFATIENNIFANNGDHNAASLWADGLTLHQSDDASIRNNKLTNNTDVGLISFGSARGTIRGNVIIQDSAESFAGLMLDSLATGDFSNTAIAQNTVSCTPGKCFFGINVGPRPWYPSKKAVFGGRLTGNTISGGTIGLNISGTQGGSQLMYVGENIFEGSYSHVQVECRSTGKLMESALSYDPSHAVIDLGENYLNGARINPDLQSSDNCIS
jgi:parallel beta-helix repeat protein